MVAGGEGRGGRTGGAQRDLSENTLYGTVVPGTRHDTLGHTVGCTCAIATVSQGRGRSSCVKEITTPGGRC